MATLRAFQRRALMVLVAFACVFAALAAALAWTLASMPITALGLVATMELLVFPFLFFLKYQHLNKQAMHPPPGYDPRTVFDRFTLDQRKLSKYICIKEMLQKWFWDVPIEEVKKGNVADLFTYGFWFKSRDQLEAEGNGHLHKQLVQELEEAWGVSFEEGHNESLPFMAHLQQDLRCHYRPMVFYLGIEVLFLLKHLLMLGIGFRAHAHRGYTYYTYDMPARQQQQQQQQQRGSDAGSGSDGGEEEGAEAGKTPILFLHGVGLGLLPYLTFVMRLAATGQPVLAVESSHLGMRWVRHVPTEDEVVDVVMEILAKERVGQVSLVGHSYGTFMSSRIVQRYPEQVQSLVLIDPVCFVMFSGKLIHNFVYKPHQSAWTTWFVARDIHHSASVCRNFYWSLLNLWPDQLPDKTLVVLSGQDELVPVKETIAMLKAEAEGVQIMYHDHHCHAEFIKDLPWQDKVVEQVAKLAAGQQHQPSEDAMVYLQPHGSLTKGSPEAAAAAAGGKLAGSARQRAGHRPVDSASSMSL